MTLLGSFLDVTKICRLCLSQDRPLLGIFSDRNQGKVPETDFISMPLKILNCVRIEVNLEDNLPDKICNRCNEQIENWIKFKDLCDNANTLLLQFAMGMHQHVDEIQQKNILTNNIKELSIETSTEFCFDDVSFLEHESFSPKKDLPDTTDLSLVQNLPDSSLVQDSLSLILSDCGNIEKNLLNVNELRNPEEEDKQKEKQIKWRQKYLKQYTKTYECGVCSSVFTKFNKLLQHDKTDHEAMAMEEVCPKCDQLFISKQRLDTHVRLRHKEKVYECEICGIKSVSEKSLKVHKLKHTGKFVCNVCGALKSSPSTLEEHLRVHSSDRNFCCEICDKVFKQRQSLQKHNMEFHSSNSGTEFKCSICSSLFKKYDAFKRHKDLHKEEKCFVCDVCGAAYKTQSSFSVHTLIHKEKKHICYICDKSFLTKNLLNRHLLIHVSRPFVCSICEKSFNRADSLSLHMKTHNTSTQVSCNICGQSFKLNRYLKRHIARIHEI